MYCVLKIGETGMSQGLVGSSASYLGSICMISGELFGFLGNCVCG